MSEYSQGQCALEDDDAILDESTPNPARVRLWTGMFIIITAVSLCSFMVGQGLNAGTSVYLVEIGSNATVAGILAGVFSVAAAIMRLLVGPLVDVIGRYPIIVSGTIIFFVGTLTCAFSESIVALTLCRTLQGIGFSMSTTATATAAADVLPIERLGEGIGYFGLGQALAMSIGPALALFLVGTDVAANLFFGLSVVCALAFVCGVFITYERHPERLPRTSAYRERHSKSTEVSHGGKQLAFDFEATETPSQTAQQTTTQTILAALHPHNLFEKRALAGALPNLFICPVFAFGIFFVGLYGTTKGIGNAGLFFTASALAMIVVRLVSGRFMDTVAPIKLAIIPTIAGLICYLLLLNVNSDVMFYTAGVFYGICQGISNPLNQSVAVKNTPPQRWGAANALVLLAIDVGIGVTAVIWGITNDLFGFQFSMYGVMVFVVLSYVVSWIMFPKGKRASGNTE